jgi:cytoskeletal protein CcmA (bactofilin family)
MSTAPERASAPPALDQMVPDAAVVERGAAFAGLLAFDGLARVEGTLRGEVIGRGRLEIGAGGTVEGTIAADVIAVAGSLRGEVHARETIDVLTGGHVNAQIETPRLKVADGGRVDGEVMMSSPEPSSVTPRDP